jgi:uncharacterized protein YjdB
MYLSIDRGDAASLSRMTNRGMSTGQTLRQLLGCLTVIAACKGGEAAGPPLPVATVRIEPASASVVVGETRQLVATLLDSRNRPLTNRTITWTSTNPSVATVANGLVTAVTVGGPVTIVASSEGQDGSATITVVPPPVATVSVSPSTATLTPRSTAQLAVTLRDAQNNVLTGRMVTYASSNVSLATVSATGLVTGVATGGPVTITVTSEGRSATAAVTVVNAVVTTVSVSPASATLAVGGTATLTATVLDQNGVALTDRTVTWASSDVAIATVSGTGVVTGVAAGGPVSVSATSEGKSGSASITVSFDPCSARTAINMGQTLTGDLAATDCTLDDGSYVDLYRLTVTASTRVQIDVASTAFDAYLLLFEEMMDGSVLAIGADNDAGPGTDARLTQTLPPGIYLIGANSLLDAKTGAYQVTVAVAAPGVTVAARDVDASTRWALLRKVSRLEPGRLRARR